MRYGAALLFWAAMGMAQQVTSPDKLPAAVSGFDDNRAHQTLTCSVHPFKPVLNFGFRFQTGYNVETSLDPYLGGRRHWYIVFRVTPHDKNGPPAYFLDSIDLPEPRQTGLIAENTGAFQVGEGRYDVRWGMVDDLGRSCRREWTVDAHLTPNERSAKVEMPPDTADDFSWRPMANANAVTKSRHVTILLNAATPIVARSAPPTDRWGMLMSMLASLVEQMPEASVRVVVFDTEQQREYFRKDDFTAADINDVAHVANARQRWAVDYQVLQNPDGGWDLLRDLENKEIHAPLPSDTVIFLGIQQARVDKIPPGMPGPESTPRFFYLKTPAPAQMPRNLVSAGSSWSDPGAPNTALNRDVNIRGPITRTLPDKADPPDLIDQSVRHLNGKNFVVYSPADFSKAFATIER
jgi:hypothetical protein